MVPNQAYAQAQGSDAAGAASPLRAAMPVVDGDAVERLASGGRDGLQVRARAGIWLVAVATGLGLVDDVFSHPAVLGSLAWVAVVQGAVMLAAWAAFGVPFFAARRREIALLGTAALCVTTGVSGLYRGDPSATILLLVLICVVVGTLFPWGMRAQIIVVIVAAGVGASAALLAGGQFNILFGTTALLAVASSIYAAYQLARQRDEIRAGLREILWGGAALEAVANGGVVITDRTGRILWVNGAFSSQTGYSFAEAVGRTPRLLKSGTQDPAVYAGLWSTVLAGRVWHGELVNRRKDGSLYEEEMTITPWHSTGDAVTHFIAVEHDVTERKHAEAMLRQAEASAHETEERFRTLVSQIPAITYIAGATRASPAQYISPQVEAILGVPVEEWLADPECFARQIHPDDRERVLGRFSVAHDTGAPISLEYRMRDRAGRVKWLHDEARLVRDVHGAPAAVLGVAVDITDRKEAEEALRSAKR